METAMTSGNDRSHLPDASELEKLPSDGGEDYNRLVFEQSPYLRQHATNPVDWYPWGDSALKKARKKDRPVFLSIGYSTCRWCHVMERESFEDAEVGDLLNNYFVPVKVDREERPDLDLVYMEACQAMTGQGGWPLNLVLTPEGAPFFATTYLPPEDRGRRAGLKTVLRKLHRLWKEEREKVEENARQVRAVLTPDKSQKTVELGKGVLEKAADQFYEQYDQECGGFGQSPKFPSPHNLQFLLRWWYRSGESRAREMVEHTLDAMQRGGMYDQVGGGFHRYSTDRRWLLPHFEKMLYDQAMHMMTCAEAYQITGEDRYARTVRDIADYLGRDMTSPDGAFYAAEDAESEGEEGKFYLWTLEEWMEVLGQTDGKLFAEMFSMKKEGNYRDESTGKRNGRNIPHRQRSFQEEAHERDMDPAQLLQRWDAARRKLLEARSDRIRPHRDEKVVTAWNGLVIAGLAVGAQALGDERLYRSAGDVADCVLEKLMNEEGRLMRYYRDAEPDVPGFLDDYAFLALGLLEMYETGFDVRHLKNSLTITRRMLDLFWEEDAGGLAMVGHDAETPLVNPHQVQDGALPSSNSVALSVLFRLALICDDQELRGYADRLMKSRSGEVLRVPSAYAGFLCGVDCALGPNREIVIAGDPADDLTREMCSVVKSRFLPRSVWLRRGVEDEKELLAEIAPYTGRMEPVDGQPSAYVCQNKTCREPVGTPDELARALRTV